MNEEAIIGDLRQLNNQELFKLAARRETLTPLELELALRVEAYVEIYGDYLENLC